MVMIFRPLRRTDYPLLGLWLAAPHVAPWWREPSDSGALEANYGPAIDGADPTEIFIVESDGEPVGLIQRYQIDDNPSWKRTLVHAGLGEPSAGIDYLIGREDRIGLGVGATMIEQFVADTWSRYPGVSVIAVPVQQDNRRSWRVLEKVGFRRVWAGQLDSDDPSDEGPSYLYLLARPKERSG